MKKLNPPVLGMAVVLFFLAGCSSMEKILVFPAQHKELIIQPYDVSTLKNSIHIFNSVDLQEKISTRKLKLKVQVIDVIVDDTAPLEKEIRNTRAEIYTQEILRRLIYSIPPNGPQVNVWRVGGGQAAAYAFERPNMLQLSFYTVATNALHTAIDQIADDVSAREQPSSVVLITDFSNISEREVNAIHRFRQKSEHSNGLTVTTRENQWRGTTRQVCIYAIGINNQFSASKLNQVDQCGFSITADHVSQARDISFFIEKMAYFDPADQDGDGVPDYVDQCSQTESTRIADSTGCHMIRDQTK